MSAQAEVSPAATRGVAVNVADWSIVGGELLSSLVNGATANYLAVSFSWRLSFGLGAVPAALMLLGWWLVMPESPRWLAQR